MSGWGGANKDGCASSGGGGERIDGLCVVVTRVIMAQVMVVVMKCVCVW